MVQVGDKLWFVPNDTRHGRREYEITVKKVGRKWIHADGYKLDVNDLVADGEGYASPGRAWSSMEVWMVEHNRRQAWQEFNRFVRDRWMPPAHLTEADIRDMLAKVRQ